MNIPWQVKIAGKLVLSRLPVDYRTWARLGAFKHGAMASLAYPQRVFREHMGFGREHGFDPVGATILEMGPGDALSTALLAKKAGADRSILVDVGNFATRDMAFYEALAADIGLPLQRGLSFNAMLRELGSTYLTEGSRSWARIADESVDYVFSHAVLEHVRRAEFAATMREVFRVLKPGGLASHNIDLKDHLGGRLNNLRFSERLWESDWFAARSGFYTNRLRPSELLRCFAEAGFEIPGSVVARFPTAPTARAVMDRTFHAMSDEDLEANGLRVMLRKPMSG